jgi:uncharacterized protein with PIN domain
VKVPICLRPCSKKDRKINLLNKEYLLDISAIFAFTDNEPGAEEMESLLKQAKLKKTRFSISLMSIMELYYITCQEKGESDATKLILLLRGVLGKRREGYPA